MHLAPWSFFSLSLVKFQRKPKASANKGSLAECLCTAWEENRKSSDFGTSGCSRRCQDASKITILDTWISEFHANNKFQCLGNIPNHTQRQTHTRDIKRPIFENKNRPVIFFRTRICACSTASSISWVQISSAF